MAKAWCLTKSGGRMLIGVPTGPDEVMPVALLRWVLSLGLKPVEKNTLLYDILV
jgi:hypothetical protein